MLAQREPRLFKARALHSRCRRLCAVSSRAKPPPGLVPKRGVNYGRFALGASFESTSRTPVTPRRERRVTTTNTVPHETGRGDGKVPAQYSLRQGL